jgi:hypothetical protein
VREAEAWASKADGLFPKGTFNVVFGSGKFCRDLLLRINMQPLLMAKGVVANFVFGFGNASQYLSICV